MAVTYGTTATFPEVTSQGVVLVDFYADWCGPCQMIAPILEELGTEYDGKFEIVKINTDENPDLSSQFRIMSIPTMLLFKNGEVVETLVGMQPKEAILAHVTKYL